MTGIEETKKLHFNEKDVWAKKVGSRVKIGISDHAQEELDEVEFVELPEIGKKVEQTIEGESDESELGRVESIFFTMKIYSPISGKVDETNEDLEMRPEAINEEPYEDGWICIIKPTNFKEEIKKLMTLEKYENFIKNKS